MYSLYRDQYQFSESIVAVLFVTGFVSAGVTAPLIGVWADQQYVDSLFDIDASLICCIVVARNFASPSVSRIHWPVYALCSLGSRFSCADVS